MQKDHIRTLKTTTQAHMFGGLWKPQIKPACCKIVFKILNLDTLGHFSEQEEGKCFLLEIFCCESACVLYVFDPELDLKANKQFFSPSDLFFTIAVNNISPHLCHVMCTSSDGDSECIQLMTQLCQGHRGVGERKTMLSVLSRSTGCNSIHSLLLTCSHGVVVSWLPVYFP